MTRGRQRVPVQCEDTISVQCQDDQFGFDAEVVYDDKSFPLRRCTPFVTGSHHRGRVPGQNQDAAAGQVQESFAVNGQMSATAGFSTTVDALDANSLTFTDGVSPGFVAPDGIGDNGHELMNRDEHYEKEKHVQPKGKKKRLKREGRTVSIQCQDNPFGVNGVVVFGDEAYGMTLGCTPDITGYNQYLTRHGNGFSAGVINADCRNNAQASRQMLPVSVVTVSAISGPMDTQNQLGAYGMDPPFTDGYVYGWRGNRSHFWERDE
ncbi:hypothetical protein Q8A67_018509 [Cirrhinus molitorella]|uniref:Uncharacterized protein n=1 Tax=Cirrhinus molitorella TaxID=172907 RepID=A0AA88PGE5_9TELE|nr:hypothetical protein Q8A67_018509 [Cirrhinus molitorella]